MATLPEAPRFPLDVVNQAAEKEKGGGRPEFWEMVFWWTRKPLASARAVLAAAALPADASVNAFVSRVLRARVNMRGEVENVPRRLNPDPPREKVRPRKLIPIHTRTLGTMLSIFERLR